jgi:hypothetical protein
MRSSVLVVAVLAFVLTACKGPPPAAALQAEPLDAVIIPGCPSREDGTLTGCQWQRAIWGAMLWEDGVTEHFITSGGAVQNRYIESEAIRAGMIALGVPADRVHTDTQAMHTDENAGYSAAMAAQLGYERIGVASHGAQARGMRAMLKGWGWEEPAVFPMHFPRVIRRIKDGLPDVRTEPVPEDEWLPRRDRERVIADRQDARRRPPSWWVYSFGIVAMRKNGAPEPPVTEPTLRGERHRVDTAPWPDGVAATN